MLTALFLIAFFLPGASEQSTAGPATATQEEAGAVSPGTSGTATHTGTSADPMLVTDAAASKGAKPGLPAPEPGDAASHAARSDTPLGQRAGGPDAPPQPKRLPQAFGLRLGQTVEMGQRVFLQRPKKSDRGKFEEFRDIPSGPFVERLHLRLENMDQSFFSEIRARGIGQEDQNLLFRTSKVGHFDASFEWDQIPHIFSDTGRTLYRKTRPGVLELDDKIQSAVQAGVGAAQGNLLQQSLAASSDTDLGLRWNVGRFILKQTPTPKWDVRYEYTRLRKEGDRPIGSLTGASPDEVLEPIEQTVHDGRLTADLTRKQWQLQFGYNVSLFENDVDSLVWDSPLRLDDSAFSGPGRSQFALAPSNIAHTGSVTGALNLPHRSRLVSTFAYGLRLQDDKFLPQTINSAITSPELTLPAKSLNGEVQTRLFNLQFTSHPSNHFSLRARYRIYDYNDQSPVLTFPAWVTNDSSLVTGDRGKVTAPRFNYTKHNGGADVGWQLLSPLSLKAGYEWERWVRDERLRAVPASDEHTPKIWMDLTPLDWLSIRASYSHSWRRISSYNPYAHLASVVSPAEFASLVPDGTVQSPLLRQYDEADRDRDRVDLLTQFNIFENLTLTPTVSYRKDRYINSPFGLQRDTSKAAGVDVAWNAAERLNVFVSYMREDLLNQQRSRYRPFAGVPDNPTYDWVGRNNDVVDTVGAGLDAMLIPNRLELHVVWNYSHAVGKMLAFNPVPPRGSSPSQDADARAVDFPDVKDSPLAFQASVRYSFKNGWFAKIGYVYERFQFTDFRTDNIQPYMGTPGDLVTQRAVFLGAQIRPYRADMIEFAYGYRF